MATTEFSLVVADAGPLIHLDELNALDVLCSYTTIFVPNTVWLEVQHHRPHALQHEKINLLRLSASLWPEKINALGSLYTLHHGEREALAICLEHAVSTLLTDDTAARLAAKSINITTHGTLGLLIRAVRQHTHTPAEIVTLLESIPQQTTLHIRKSLLDEVISRVKIEWKDELST